jgi:hypothetical protein
MHASAVAAGCSLSFASGWFRPIQARVSSAECESGFEHREGRPWRGQSPNRTLKMWPLAFLPRPNRKWRQAQIHTASKKQAKGIYPPRHEGVHQPSRYGRAGFALANLRIYVTGDRRIYPPQELRNLATPSTGRSRALAPSRANAISTGEAGSPGKFAS